MDRTKLQEELFSRHTDSLCARNTEQQAVIEAATDRHLQIVAGPGAGKTRVLIKRIVHLLGCGHLPTRMAVITYTNSARDELIERMDKEVGHKGRGLFVGTIHQFCLKLVIANAHALGLSDKIRVLDQSEAERMFAARVNTQGWGDARRLFLDLSLERERWDGVGRAPWQDSDTDRVWNRFDEIIRRLGLATFTSLQLWALQAVEHASEPAVDFIFVDEYQDTTGLQVRLLDSMAKLGTLITVVGDPEQSIFAFAGADPSQLGDFPKRFSPCSCHRLDANGRSTESIVRLAGALRGETGQFALRSHGQRPVLWYLNSASQQAKMVAAEIGRLLDKGKTTAEQVAVLARESGQLRIAAELEKLGIAYWQSRNERFEEKHHVRQLIILLEALCFPEDECAQLFLFEQVLKGAPKTWEFLVRELRQGCGFDDAIAVVHDKVTRPRRAVLEQFENIRHQFREMGHMSPPSLVLALYEQIIKPRFGIRELRTIDSLTDDIQGISDAAQEHSTVQDLAAWLRQGGLAPPQGVKDTVTLGTLHFAKGREWDVVFVVDLTLGVIPHRLNPDREEERRLLHVGVSRARDLLYLSSPRRLPSRGEGHSPFIDRFRSLCRVVDLRS